MAHNATIEWRNGQLVIKNDAGDDITPDVAKTLADNYRDISGDENIVPGRSAAQVAADRAELLGVKTPMGNTRAPSTTRSIPRATRDRGPGNTPFLSGDPEGILTGTNTNDPGGIDSIELQKILQALNDGTITQARADQLVSELGYSYQPTGTAPQDDPGIFAKVGNWIQAAGGAVSESMTNLLDNIGVPVDPSPASISRRRRPQTATAESLEAMNDPSSRAGVLRRTTLEALVAKFIADTNNNIDTDEQYDELITRAEQTGLNYDAAVNHVDTLIGGALGPTTGTGTDILDDYAFRPRVTTDRFGEQSAEGEGIFSTNVGQARPRWGNRPTLEPGDDGDMFNDIMEWTPYENFLDELNLGELGEDILNRIRPRGMEAHLSQTRGGRSQLFGDFMDRMTGFGSADIIGDVLQRAFAPASSNFLLQNAIGSLPSLTSGQIPLGEGGTLGSVDIGPSFSSFLKQPGGRGGFDDALSTFLGLANMSGTNLQGMSSNKPFMDLRQTLINDPNQALQMIQSQNQGPMYSPFASTGAGTRAQSTAFNQLQANNPNLTGLDILNRYSKGGWEGIFQPLLNN
jgi:hypothetical protein